MLLSCRMAKAMTGIRSPLVVFTRFFMYKGVVTGCYNLNKGYLSACPDVSSLLTRWRQEVVFAN